MSIDLHGDGHGAAGPEEPVTRAQLHEMVWREPLSRIAPRFGVSDVTLRRICQRYDIPRPAPGYWSKIAYGKPVRKAPLSVEERSSDERIFFHQPNEVFGWLLSAVMAGIYAFLVSAEV